ncbi:hypothetical protein [Azospirillum palustre]|uniref:hypothetical protein n=1 Tax=Azospirillum palustre TaxID=2044885 RepID=UPI00137A38F9|nr:hypothetical protein [Azospirillum palustre]
MIHYMGSSEKSGSSAVSLSTQGADKPGNGSGSPAMPFCAGGKYQEYILQFLEI